MSTLATVKRILTEAAKVIPGAEVIAPLPVWDGAAGSMGVQIKAPQLRGSGQPDLAAGQMCEVTANFVLSHADLTHEHRIRFKALSAVTAMLEDIQIQIRPYDCLREAVENSASRQSRVA